jgi:DNA-binding transcriptional LysR family regulator
MFRSEGHPRENAAGIELRDLKWALVTSQHRSLRQAAETLNIRQSTLSRSLRNLEHRLGAVLFQRTNGGTRPTIEGREFLESARRIVEEIDAIAVRLKTRSRGESGRLAIGIHTSLAAGNLRATLIEYRRRFPEVETYLVDGSSNHLISDLANATIDVAFVAENEPSWQDRSLPVWSERVVVAMAGTHPFNDQEAVHWHELKREPLLLPSRGPGPEFSKLLCSKGGANDSLRLLRHDVSLDRLLTLVGLGWGLLLALEGAIGSAQSGVSFREVHDLDGPMRLTFRAYWRQGNSNPSLFPFIEMLRERYPDLSGDQPRTDSSPAELP